MPRESFHAVLMAGHMQMAVEVPLDPAARWSRAAKPLWPGRRGFAVAGTANGKPFDSYVVARSKKFYLPIDAEVRQRLGLSIGDELAITIAPHDPVSPR